jgi:F-type H+-transporting ATPase subunit delta
VTNRTAANRYARALIEVGSSERADLERIHEELSGFEALLAAYPELKHALTSPAIPSARKRAAVADLTGRAATSAIVSKLLALLAERDRLILLPDLVAAYHERLLDYRQVVRAEVVTAAQLPPETVGAIQRRLAIATGRTVSLQARVDPSIIGGLVAKVGSTVFDASVTGQLQKMKARLET